MLRLIVKYNRNSNFTTPIYSKQEEDSSPANHNFGIHDLKQDSFPADLNKQIQNVNYYINLEIGEEIIIEKFERENEVILLEVIIYNINTSENQSFTMEENPIEGFDQCKSLNKIELMIEAKKLKKERGIEINARLKKCVLNKMNLNHSNIDENGAANVPTFKQYFGMKFITIES